MEKKLGKKTKVIYDYTQCILIFFFNALINLKERCFRMPQRKIINIHSKNYYFNWKKKQSRKSKLAEGVYKSSGPIRFMQIFPHADAHADAHASWFAPRRLATSGWPWCLQYPPCSKLECFQESRVYIATKRHIDPSQNRTRCERVKQHKRPSETKRGTTKATMYTNNS